VVVHVDEASSHEAALSWAADQAQAENRPLVVVAMTPSAPGSALTHPRERERAEAYLTDHVTAIRQRRPDLHVHPVVTTADSVPALVELSHESNLLVIGKHVSGTALSTNWGVDALLAGRSACPIVVVPHHHPGRVRRGVLAGVDLSEHSGEVLDFAFRQASVRGLPLTVMACTRHDADVDEHHRRLAEVTSGYRELFPDVAVTCEVGRGRPTHELVRASGAMDLLVVGRHQPTGLTRSPVGHVRAGVVDRSSCPVAVVPVTR
jgi:nucleotide-binding universal stress UspA family protein